MDVIKFTISNYTGYRFRDARGRGCSVHQCEKGVTIGVNISGGDLRMLLDQEGALWVAQVLLNYVETGRI